MTEQTERICKNCGAKVVKPKRNFCCYDCMYKYCKKEGDRWITKKDIQKNELKGGLE